MSELEILSLFHHVHHENGKHIVHHCGNGHVEFDATVDYQIDHCICGKHKINKKLANGHSISKNLELMEVNVEFLEKCPQGGWHIESGTKVDK